MIQRDSISSLARKSSKVGHAANMLHNTINQQYSLSSIPKSIQMHS